MVQVIARARIQAGGTQVSRRTVDQGMAWTVPVVAVATAAPAYATISQSYLSVSQPVVIADPAS